MPGFCRAVRPIFGLVLILGLAAGCSIASYRREADRAALDLIQLGQEQALGRAEPFTIEPPSETLRRRLLATQNLPVAAAASLGSDRLDPVPHWPEAGYPTPTTVMAVGEETVLRSKPYPITLLDALQVGAKNSRTYQTRKEELFRAALSLELARDKFRLTFSGLLENSFGVNLSGDKGVRNLSHSGSSGVLWRLKNGATLAGSLVVDLANLLSQDRGASRGLLFDGSISIPLLSGSGEHIVTEPLTQAEHDLLYAIRRFERFKKSFAVQVASEYLAVLQQADQVANAKENYDNLMSSATRAQALADAGRLSGVQVDQALQNELRARDRWISARSLYGRRLDGFKISLGLPTDARIALDPGEIARLAKTAETPLVADAEPKAERAEDPLDLLPGSDPPEAERPFGMTEATATAAAFERRQDLIVEIGRVEDAQRKVVVAADALGFELNFIGTGSVGGRRTLGSARSANTQLHFDKGNYSAGFELNLPWEKTAEQNGYRDSLISLESAVRAVQELEDRIKQQVREALRKLKRTRESFRIQQQAVKLALRRVESTNLFLLAGRAQIRDLLEAQESLISAQNARTSALVDYRIATLEFQRDIGVLEVNEKGIWREYAPTKKNDQ